MAGSFIEIFLILCMIKADFKGQNVILRTYVHQLLMYTWYHQFYDVSEVLVNDETSLATSILKFVVSAFKNICVHNT